MAFDAHKNFAFSQVATAPSPATSGTSLTVVAGDGAKFPAASFNAVVWPVNTQPSTTNAEIVRVTVISTDTFTITRTQESTSARSIVIGDQIAAGITAKSLTDIESGGLLTSSAFAAGPVVQVVNTQFSAVATGTTLIPFDDTIPQNTEGDQYMTQAITPLSASDTLVIDIIFFGSLSIGNDLIVALFQDTTANALAATSVFNATATARDSITLRYVMAAGTTSSTTFKVRAGGPTASTTTFNGNSSARLYGTTIKSSITIWEYKS